MKAVLYDWGGLNVWLFHVINNLRAETVDALMELGTTLGDHDRFALYLAAVAVAALWRWPHTAEHAPAAPPATQCAWLVALATFSLAYWLDGVLVTWLKEALDFPRPPLALPPDSLHVIAKPELHHSLPSGHSVFAMTLAASLWPLAGRKARIALSVFVLWVGVSRVSLGAHFPADVVAGWLLGAAVVVGVRLLLAWLPGLRQPAGDARRD